MSAGDEDETMMDEKSIKRQLIKEKLNELFVNYAEFSSDKGDFYIPYTALFRMFRESKILDYNTQNTFSVIVKKECGNKNGIKSIPKRKFLNIILHLSKYKFPKLFTKHPKLALYKLIDKYLMPLLNNQEAKGVYHSTCLRQINSINMSTNDVRILHSVAPMVEEIYNAYFDRELLGKSLTARAPSDS